MKRVFFLFILLFIGIGFVYADEWCYLDSLSFRNVDYDIGFNSTKYDYYLPVSLEINSLDLDYYSTSDCMIEVIGNEDLKQGNNKVLIKLSKDNHVTTYGITVDKRYMSNGEEEKQETFPIVYVGFGFAILSIVVGIFFVIHDKKTK